MPRQTGGGAVVATSRATRPQRRMGINNKVLCNTVTTRGRLRPGGSIRELPSAAGMVLANFGGGSAPGCRRHVLTACAGTAEDAPSGCVPPTQRSNVERHEQLIGSSVRTVADMFSARLKFMAHPFARLSTQAARITGERPAACGDQPVPADIHPPPQLSTPGGTKMPKKILIAAGVASGLACLLPLTALAQAAATAASPAASAADGQIATVIITGAEAQEEDIRDVPLSVSVMSGEQLQAQQIKTGRGFDAQHPQHLVLVAGRTGPGHRRDPGRELAGPAPRRVSVYLDDVSLTTRNLYSQGTAEPRFFDLQDAEVLRGPAGHAVRRELAGRHDQVHQQAAGPEVLLRLDQRDGLLDAEGRRQLRIAGHPQHPADQGPGSAAHRPAARPRQRLRRPGGLGRQADLQGHQPRRLHRPEARVEGQHRRQLERHAGAVRAEDEHRRHRRDVRLVAPLPDQQDRARAGARHAGRAERDAGRRHVVRHVHGRVERLQPSFQTACRTAPRSTTPATPSSTRTTRIRHRPTSRS